MIRSMFGALASFVRFIFSVCLGIALAFSLREYVFVNAIVPTESMVPTVAAGDLLVGSRVTYVYGSPERGDIVTLERPEEPGTTYLKRVIGLPGETLEVVDGKVYINGSDEPLDEPYVNPDDLPIGDFGPYEIPEDYYFLMGDNRNVSYDSRYWDNPFVHEDDISSKIIFRYYPNFELVE